MSVNEKMTAIGDAIRAKTGGTELLSLDAMASAIAAIESGGGGIDISLFEGMGFEEGSFTLASDTYIYDNLVQTSFGQCYGGFVFTEVSTAIDTGYFDLGFYLAYPNENKRECVHRTPTTAYKGGNLALGGYYPANCIYITDSQSRMEYQAGKTYKWVAWGV